MTTKAPARQKRKNSKSLKQQEKEFIKREVIKDLNKTMATSRPSISSLNGKAPLKRPRQVPRPLPIGILPRPPPQAIKPVKKSTIKKKPKEHKITPKIKRKAREKLAPAILRVRGFKKKEIKERKKGDKEHKKEDKKLKKERKSNKP